MNNHGSTRLESLHVNRFSSELVHRHINPDDYQSSQHVIYLGKACEQLNLVWKLVFLQESIMKFINLFSTCKTDIIFSTLQATRDLYTKFKFTCLSG